MAPGHNKYGNSSHYDISVGVSYKSSLKSRYQNSSQCCNKNTFRLRFREQKTVTKRDYRQTPFLNQFYQTIDEHKMVQTGQSILLGVSGGPDSVALLLLFLSISDDLCLNLGIAHINHLLRKEESKRDELFVQELARAHNLPFYLKEIDVGKIALREHQSLEEAARDVRFDFFDTICEQKGYDKIALGHTLDDNAELVLMNILRGSGPKGLSGIPPTRNDRIIRPLIGQSKNDILCFLNSRNQDYVIDSSNLGNDFLRNRVRHFLLPLIEQEYNPGITETLNRLSRIIRDEDAWMEAETGAIFNQMTTRVSGSEIHLSLDLFKALPTALKRRILRKTLEQVKKDLRRITLTHIDAIEDIATAGATGKSLDLPDRIRITKQNNTLCFKKESRPLREIGKALKRKKRLQKKTKVSLA